MIHFDFGLPERELGKQFCSVISAGAAILGASAIQGGASIFSGLFGSSAADDQAEAIIQAAQIARQTTLELFEQGREDLAPFREGGERALGTLSDILFGGSENLNNVLKRSPLLNFQLEEGTEAINEQLSARGLFGSGAGVELLSDFVKGLTAEEGERTIARLFGLTQLGQASAAQSAQLTSDASGQLSNQSLFAGAGVGNAAINRGAAQSSAAIGVGNAATGGIGSFQQSDMLSRILGQLNPGAGGSASSVFTVPTGNSGSGLQTSRLLGNNQQSLDLDLSFF